MLHIKSDASEYLEPVRLETVIRKWADHITLPITVARDGKDQPANEGTALWRKAKSETTEQSYKEFYRHLGHFFDDPWATLHWRAEGTLEYFCLLFIPGMKPFDAVEGDRDAHVRLHVRRMFITDKADLLPHWLRFVSGVVDTEDLPLNVSREMLQTTPVLARIRKALIGRVMAELEDPHERSRRLQQVLGEFRPDPEGRRLGGRRIPRRDRAAAAFQVLDAGGLDLAARLRRRGCRKARTRSTICPATRPRR